MGEWLRKYTLLLISVALVAATLAVYWPVLKYDFVRYDDDKYITENRRITGGLTGDSIVWAFTRAHYHMWHPLTTLSQMLDCKLFGLDPGRHHLTSLLFHLVNTVLLFLVLKKMTGAVWPSAFVAAVFALHPLQVESVAWLAERKNVLSGLFWILTIGAYVRYAQRPGVPAFLLVVLVFGLCIMTKPIVVTLPFVLFLLDYWPLERFRFGPKTGTEPADRHSPPALFPDESTHLNFRKAQPWLLIVEKIPFFVLAAVLSVITFTAQRGGGVMSGLEKLPLKSRAANALISYLTYIEKMVWPSGLAVFYPHPAGKFSVVKAALSAVLLALLTILCLCLWRRRKYLATGWLWYVGTLVPVIGLVQVGAQARADRYMYLTMIGLLVVVAWAISDMVARYRRLRVLAFLAALVMLTGAAVCTRLQLRHWKNSEALFRHALDVTQNNVVMHNNYANLLHESGKLDEAVRHYEKSLKLRPNSAEIHNNFANVLSELGRADDAVIHYKRALELKSNFAVAHYNLAGLLAKQADLEGAIKDYQQAVKIKPDYVEAWGELGFVLAQKGLFEDAIDCYEKAIELKPDFVIAHGRLGLALAQLGRNRQAVEQFLIVLKARPDDSEMHFNVGFLLEHEGQINEAISHYRRALEISPDFAQARQRLQALLAGQKSRQ